jgi:hypothetical protein
VGGKFRLDALHRRQHLAHDLVHRLVALSKIRRCTACQVTEMQNVGRDGVWINNGSCADYYLRVVARLRLVAPDAATK